MNDSLTWDKLAKFHLIEVVALWEGRLTTNHLQNAFGISRGTASSLISVYKQQLPGNLIQCTKTKGYIPSDSFECRFSRGDAREYLSLLNSHSDLNPEFAGLMLRDAPTEVLGLPHRNIKPEVVRILVESAQDHKRIEVRYRSLSSPDGEERIIAPHSIVSAEGRWHVRAWCEKHRDFRDFVLNRFTDNPEIIGDALPDAQPQFDKDWNTLIDLELAPNSELSAGQQQLIADDYGMDAKHRLIIPVRTPPIKYLMLSLNIQIDTEITRNPKAQPLIVKNRRAVEPYLF